MSKENILLSIIIPFYNVDNYISKCLDSIYNQDISEDQFEVICVNDASLDKSIDIVLEFQKKHKNLILVEHEINKRLGAARNTGRSTAKGKYIWNVDSDDYIKSNVFKLLIDICMNNDLDVLMFNFFHNTNGIERLNENYPFPDSNIYDGITFLKKFCVGHFGEISPVWSQIYRADFLSMNNITSPEYNYAEDAPFTFKSLFLAKRVKSIVSPCYVYKLNENSIGSTIELNPTANKLYEKCIISTIELKRVSKFIPKSETELKDHFLMVYKYTISLIPYYFSRMTIYERRQFAKICRMNFISNISIVSLLNKKNKLFYFLCVILPIKKYNSF